MQYISIVFAIIINKGFSIKVNTQITAETFLELINTVNEFQAKGLAGVIGKATQYIVLFFFFHFYDTV